MSTLIAVHASTVGLDVSLEACCLSGDIGGFSPLPLFTLFQANLFPECSAGM